MSQELDAEQVVSDKGSYTLEGHEVIDKRSCLRLVEQKPHFSNKQLQGEIPLSLTGRRLVDMFHNDQLGT